MGVCGTDVWLKWSLHPYTHTPIHPYTHTPIQPYGGIARYDGGTGAESVISPNTLHRPSAERWSKNVPSVSPASLAPCFIRNVTWAEFAPTNWTLAWSKSAIMLPRIFPLSAF